MRWLGSPRNYSVHGEEWTTGFYGRFGDHIRLRSEYTKYGGASG
jgi:hypothetical protein